MIVKATAYPRVGLIGNPSDGFYGKTIAFAFTDFAAEVTLYESPDLEILPNTRDHSRFEGIAQLAQDVRQFGYYGGIRLVKAAIKRFHDYARDHGLTLHDGNFTMRYRSNIPHLVGLAGSSAIITACLRALMQFYQVAIPRPVLANLILAVEKEELQIAAGLQDRVAQVYQGLVYMDFDRTHMEQVGYGRYEELDPAVLPPLYVAYRADLAEVSGIVHGQLRERFQRGDRDVVEAVAFWASLTDQVRDLLVRGEGRRIGPLLDANFDRRRAVCRISEGNLRLVEAARSVGASAKFSGSGGAIVGAYDDARMFQALVERLAKLQVRVLRPVVAPATKESGR